MMEKTMRLVITSGIVLIVLLSDVTAQAAEPTKATSLYQVREWIAHRKPIWSLCFTPDGKQILSGSADGTIGLWDVATGKGVRQFVGHRGGVRQVVISPDGKTFASGGFDRAVRLWNLKTGQPLSTVLQHPQLVDCVAFSPDGRLLASGARDMVIRIWDVTTGKELRQLTGHAGSIAELAFSPNGKRLASCAYKPPQGDKGKLSGTKDNIVRIWDVETGKSLQRLKGHDSSPIGLVFSDDGSRLLTYDMRNAQMNWSAATGERVGRLRLRGESALTKIIFASNRRFVLRGYLDDALNLYDLKRRRTIRVFHGQTTATRAIALSPDSRLIVTGGDDLQIRLWTAPNLDRYIKLVELNDRQRDTDDKEKVKSDFEQISREHADQLAVVPVHLGKTQRKWQRITLNQDGTRVDGIRFTSPLKVPADFSWAFHVSPPVHYSWNIIGIEKKLDSFVTYRGHTRSVSHIQTDLTDLPTKNQVFFQSLEGGQIQPGKDYVLGFSFKNIEPVELRFIIYLAPEGSIESTDTFDGLAAAVRFPTPIKQQAVLSKATDQELSPIRAAEIDVEDSIRTAFSNTNGWTGVPEFLEGQAIAYELAGKKSNPAEIRFTVKKTGVILLAAAWDSQVKKQSNWYRKSKKRDQLIDQSWALLGTVTRKLGDGEPTEHHLFRRIVTAGEKYHFYTRKKGRPFVIALQSNTAAEAVLTSAAEKIVLPENKSAKNMALSPDGRTAVVVEKEDVIVLREVSTGRTIAEFAGYSRNPWVTFSPDGRLLATCGSQGRQLRIWDVTTRTLFAELDEFDNRAMHAAFSPDGETLTILDASYYSSDGKVMFWDVKRGKSRASIKFSDRSIASIAYSPDGKFLASVGWRGLGRDSDKQVRLWDIKTQQTVRTWSSQFGSAYKIAFSPDQHTLAIAEWGGERSLQVSNRIRLVDYRTGKEIGTLVGHTERINALAFSADGKELISGGKDHTLRAWNVETLSLRAVQMAGVPTIFGTTFSRWVQGNVTFSGDSFAVVSGKPTVRRLEAFRTDPQSAMRALNTSGRHRIRNLTFSPGGESLVVAASNSQSGVYQTKTWESRDDFPASNRLKAVSVDVGLLANRDDSGKIITVEESTSGSLVGRFEVKNVIVLAWIISPDKQFLAAAYKDKSVRVWHLPSGKLFAKVAHPKSQPTKLAFSPDGIRLATAGYDSKPGNIHIWDLSRRKEPTGEPLIKLKMLEHGTYVTGLTYSPDGKLFATGGKDNMIKIWGVNTGKVIRVVSGYKGFFSADSKKLATVSEEGDPTSILLWDVAMGEQLHQLSGGHPVGVNVVAFSPDGRRLASGDNGGYVTLWDVATGKQSWEPLKTAP